MSEAQREKIAYCFYAGVILLVALSLRSYVFNILDEENDEQIFRALVEQISRGAGYTLRGHPTLTANYAAIARTYDAPVFLHPPAGILYFYFVGKIFGFTRFAMRLAQPIAFTAYYLAGLAAVDLYLPGLDRACRLLAAPLFAFTPIYVHTNLKVWLENPRLAFFLIHMACLALYLRAPSGPKAALAAATSLLPVLTRVDSLAAYPFLYFFSDTLFPRHRRFLAGLLALNLAAAAAWLAYSHALDYGPGRPPAELVAQNPFLHFFTVEFGTGRYIGHFLLLTTSFVPAALAAFFLRSRPNFALLLWVLSQLALYGGLGFFGYMKLQRFLILALPATILLALLAADGLKKTRRTPFVVVLSLLLAVGCAAEIGQGVAVALTNGTEASLRPLF